MTHRFLPYVTGPLMGVAMLWMLHGILSQDGGPVGLVFVAAHFAALSFFVGLSHWARRRFRGTAHWLRTRLPSFRHVAKMLGAAFLTALLLHFAIHTIGPITWI